MQDLVKNTPFEQIAKRGSAIYDKIRGKYERRSKGKYLAIEPDTKSVYMGDTGIDAIEKARIAHEGKLFYLVKIGYDSVEMMTRSVLGLR